MQHVVLGSNKKNGLSEYFKETVEATKISIFSLLEKSPDPYTLERLLTEATGEQVYKLVAVFRENAKYWKKFLIALLELPPDTWDNNEIFPEVLQKYFSPEETRQLLKMHSDMITDGKQSPIMSFLQFARLR